MKRKIAILLTLLTVVFANPVWASEFSDVPSSHWAYETIGRLSDKGIINGMGDGTYSPDGTLTKAQFIKLLTCALDDFNPEKTYKPVFFDTNKDEWYTPYVTCGVESGIINTEERLFYPDNAISRGEAAIWIVNGLGINKEAECKFADVSDTEQKRAVAIASNIGIINGYEDGTFKPNNSLTRAEASALISRTMDKIHVFGQIREDAKNEVILKESVKVIETGKNNIIKKADSTRKTITFSSPSDVVKNIKKGDVLYIPETSLTGEGFIKATSVQKSGNDVVVGVGTPDISEVLDTLDISAVVSPTAEDLAKNDYVSDITPIAGTKERKTGLSTEVNITGDASINPEAQWVDGKLVWKIPAHGDAGASFTLKTKNYDDPDKKGAYASVNMSMNIFLDVKLSGENFDAKLYSKAEVDSNITAVAGFKASKTVTESIELPAIEFSVSGPITVEVTPYIVATAGGNFNVEATAVLTNNIGCELKDGEFTTWSDPTINSTLEANADGYLEIGPRMVAEVGLVDFEFKVLGKEIKVDAPEILNFTADMGIGVKGKTEIDQKAGANNSGVYYEGHQNTPDENGVIHHCYFCVDGEIYSYDKFSFGLSEDLNNWFEGIINKKLTYTSDKVTIPFSQWYYSLGQWGEECELASCPHKLVRVTGTVTEEDTGEKIPGATIKAEPISAYKDFEKKNLADIKSDITDSDGKYKIFLEPGNWKFTVTEEAHEDKTATVSVPDDKETSKNFIMELKEIEIAGLVTNSKTSEAIPGAKVDIGDKYTTTDSNGYYILTVKPKDTYTVKVTGEGFLDYSSSLEVKTDNIILSISMQPDNRWQEAYKSIIKKEGNYAVVTLADLDNDDIPELILSTTPGSGVFSIFSKGYTYKNGKVQPITVNEDDFIVSYKYEKYINNTTGEYRIEGNRTVRAGWAYSGGTGGIFTLNNNILSYTPVHGWNVNTTQSGKDYIETHTYDAYYTGGHYEISEAEYNNLKNTMHAGWTKDTTYKYAYEMFYKSVKNSDITALFKLYETGMQ